MAVSGVSQTRSHLNAYEHLTLIGKSNALCPPLPLLPYYHPHRRCPVLFLLHPFVGVKYSSKSPVMPAAVSNFFRFLSRARAGSRARARAREDELVLLSRHPLPKTTAIPSFLLSDNSSTQRFLSLLASANRYLAHPAENKE